MYFLLFVAVLVLATVLLIFISSQNIKLSVRLDRENTDITLLWLRPLFKAVAFSDGRKPVLKVFLFGKNIYNRPLKAKSSPSPNPVELIRQVEPRNVNINAYYGFKDPFITGIACGAINIASQFINTDSINQNPDFTSGNDYIHFDATAKVKLGTTLFKLYRTRRTGSESQ